MPRSDAAQSVGPFRMLETRITREPHDAQHRSEYFTTSSISSISLGTYLKVSTLYKILMASVAVYVLKAAHTA